MFPLVQEIDGISLDCPLYHGVQYNAAPWFILDVQEVDTYTKFDFLTPVEVLLLSNALNLIDEILYPPFFCWQDLLPGLSSSIAGLYPR